MMEDTGNLWILMVNHQIDPNHIKFSRYYRNNNQNQKAVNQMPRFTYEQCDRIHKKMSNFDSIVCRIDRENSSLPEKQLLRTQSKESQLLRMQSKNGMGKPIMDKDFNRSKELMKTYESGCAMMGKADRKIPETNVDGRMLRKGKENFIPVQQGTRSRVLDYCNYTLKAAQNKSIVQTRKPTHTKNLTNQSLQYSSIQHEPPSQASLSHMLEQGYSMIVDETANYQSRQQKSQTINCLNSQIKQIMSKYDYEFSQDEVRGLVGERITLPSFRQLKRQGEIFEGVSEYGSGVVRDYLRNFSRMGDNNLMSKMTAHAQRKSSGFIRVEQSLSSQEIRQQTTLPIPQTDNEFSPYSDKKLFPNKLQNKLPQTSPNTAKPMIKKQINSLNACKIIINSKTKDLCKSKTFNEVNEVEGDTKKDRAKIQNLKVDRQIIMCKSQLVEDDKSNRAVNINRGHNDFNLTNLNVRDPSYGPLQSSQKKKARYMHGYMNWAEPIVNSHPQIKGSLTSTQNFPNRQNTRMSYGWMPKNRSQLIDRSIEELNQRMQQVEEKKRRLNVEMKPFNLDRFQENLRGDGCDSFAGDKITVYPSFQIKKQEIEQIEPLKQKLEIGQVNQNPSIEKLQNHKGESPLGANTPPTSPQLLNNQLEPQMPVQNLKIQSQPASLLCQIDSVFNSVSIGVLSERQKIHKSEVGLDCSREEEEEFNQSNFMNTTDLTHNVSRNIKGEQLNYVKNRLSLVSNTNALTITSQQCQKLTVQQQPSLQQPTKQTYSAQKRLNRSSLLIKKPQNTKNAFELLLINLIQQISLDQHFRNLKTWFQFYCDHPQKNKELRKLLAEKLAKRKERLEVRRQFQGHGQKEDIVNEGKIIETIERDLMEVERVFAVSVNQHDPFFKLDGFIHNPLNSGIHKEATCFSEQANNRNPYNYCLQSLVSAYECCQQHWTRHVYKKLLAKDLLSSGFTSAHLDLQRKGCTELEDLVRVVNMNTGAGYRNRDLVIVWERIGAVKQEQEHRSKNDVVGGKTQRVQFKFLLRAFSDQDRI